MSDTTNKRMSEVPPWKAALTRLSVAAEPIAEENVAAYKRIVEHHIASLEAENAALKARPTSEAVREVLEWLCFEHQPKMCATCTRSWGDHPPDFATCSAETDCLFGAALATITAATSTPQEGLACLVERCGCDGSAPCGQDDISECVPAVRVQCVECARLDTSDCLYADEHMVDDGCWFDARNASRPKVAEPTVPQEVVEAWERYSNPTHHYGRPIDWQKVDADHATIDHFIRGEATDE